MPADSARAETSRPPRDRFGRWALIWVLLLLSAWVGERFIRSALLTAETPRTIDARGDLAEIERRTIELFEAASPSVVYIFVDTFGIENSIGEDNHYGATGSGVVWDRDGHIVTNNHVVNGAKRVRVRLDNGEAIEAKVVGSAPHHDLAVIKLTDVRSSLKPIPLGSSSTLKVGQSVFAIGNPFGWNRSLSAGVISALNRRMRLSSTIEIPDAIQTDAAINPGNSGGPLLDSAGRLIGITTTIESTTGSFAGIGFAVPSDMVNRVVPALIRDGRAPRPGIGILAAPEETAARLGVAGLVVMQVQPGGPADRAGIKAFDRATGQLGDVITHVQAKPVETIADLSRELDKVGIGHMAELTVTRDSKKGRVAQSVQVQVRDIAVPNGR